MGNFAAKIHDKLEEKELQHDLRVACTFHPRRLRKMRKYSQRTINDVLAALRFALDVKGKPVMDVTAKDLADIQEFTRHQPSFDLDGLRLSVFIDPQILTK